ncbi:Acyltransferase [Monaibacterium marinum]|uniref:Acyltransferase n=1 Tax=Pontivivens marinum TaxID=1690039 RepID=A0A2C9CNK1_9RHOB|nr:1-acyl-sn-glycerol-3-phosphate acyltransferase [Monaibacterium marinum]SOH92966.1 Acyltransferase [Monaibacterium marinum]
MIDDAPMDLNPRDLSYSAIAKGRLGRLTIRTLENLTGRPQVLMRLRPLADRIAQGQPIWDALWDVFDLKLNRIGPPLPATGPLLVIANHPYGLLDSLALCKMLSETGQPFKIVANEVYGRAGPIADYILPISFDSGREAARRNLQTRRAALAALNAGQIVAMFPAGATACPPRPFQRPHECPWSSFTARIAMESGAPIAPICFPTQSRPFFDNVGFVHPTLRNGLQINGFYQRIGSQVDAYTAAPFTVEQAITATDATAAMRRKVLTLGPDKTDPSVEGAQF